MGLGFKDWAAGDVPTAAEFDGYLQRQTVMVFASTSARDTALAGSLEEGMVTYNSDNDEFWTYDGSGWVRLTPHLSGVSVTRATDQTISASATANISWTSEDADTDSFIAVTADTITIPAGLGGVYSLTFRIKHTGGSGSVDDTSVITIAGEDYLYAPDENITASKTDWVVFSWTGVLAPTDTVVATVTEGTASSVNVQAGLDLYRVGR